MRWLIVLWTVFTTALAVWWWILGLRLVNSQTGNPGFHRMFMAEGSVLVFLIIAGGAALGYSVWKIRLQNLALREFFATFTHEIKTSLTNLRLQTELIQEDQPNSVALKRLLQESTRLELQFENSLEVARDDSSRLFIEDIRLKEFLQRLAENWPAMKIQLEISQDLVLRADRRALEAIFRNIFQNALVHGEASEVRVVASPVDSFHQVRISNNGKPFTGESRQLGKMFVRQQGTSGTGIGLSLVKKLMSRLGGRSSFDIVAPSRLEVALFFPKGGA